MPRRWRLLGDVGAFVGAVEGLVSPLSNWELITQMSEWLQNCLGVEVVTPTSDAQLEVQYLFLSRSGGLSVDNTDGRTDGRMGVRTDGRRVLSS